MNKFGSVVLSAPGGEGFVELAKTSRGRLFRKQILHMDSEFVHPNVPGKKIKVDKALATSLVNNFQNGVADIVQVPIVDAQNKHVEDPLRNLGEVVDLEFDNKGVYAIIDARKEEYAKELGSTLLGASALMHMDYKDTRTGKPCGPALLHVAVTNRPYITNLNGFEEIIAASADSMNDEPVVLSPALPSTTTSRKRTKMELDELLTMLKDEHGIDVAALQDAAKTDHTQELVSAMSNVLREAGVVSLSNTEEEEPLTITDVADAVIELAQEKVQLAEAVQTLVEKAEGERREAVTKEVDGFVSQGRILPKQRDRMLKLAMEDREAFDDLLPDTAIVDLSQSGVDTHETPSDSVEAEKFKAETERLVKLARGEK